jgi:hypothetical protein
MKTFNWKLIFFPFAVVAVLLSVFTFLPDWLAIALDDFANWVADREYGDPAGKFWETRESALKEQEYQQSRRFRQT